MTAYYNENDPYAAQWLRNLIAAGLIAPGDVDERDIREVQASDLTGYRQCHFFGGIGGWSYALRLAGWPDDRPVWTGSCPCPPFSSAGKKKACPCCGGENPVPHVGRTGYFICCTCGHEWLADGRHLWPEMWRLIRDGRPSEFFGEQVAGADGRIWFTTVRASVEILGLACWAADYCAAGVGAPHIRQRILFVAYRQGRGRGERGDALGPRQSGHLDCSSDFSRMADDDGRRCSPAPGSGDTDRERHAEPCGSVGNAEGEGRNRAEYSGVCGTEKSKRERVQRFERPGATGDIGDTECTRSQGQRRECRLPESCGEGETGRTGSASFWANAEWIHCTDGKARPVEPGTFPLAHGVPGRVGLLRGYGNAINPQATAEFIKAYAELI